MERLVKGDIIVLPYPSFDLKSAKKRPAVVLATSSRGVIVCPITTKQLTEAKIIPIKSEDIITGKLRAISYSLPWWISTFQYNQVLYKAGTLHPQKCNEIMLTVTELFSK